MREGELRGGGEGGREAGRLLEQVTNARVVRIMARVWDEMK